MCDLRNKSKLHMVQLLVLQKNMDVAYGKIFEPLLSKLTAKVFPMANVEKYFAIADRIFLHINFCQSRKRVFGLWVQNYDQTYIVQVTERVTYLEKLNKFTISILA